MKSKWGGSLNKVKGLNIVSYRRDHIQRITKKDLPKIE